VKQGTGRRFLPERSVIAMNERSEWADLRDRRLAEPGAAQAYEAARVAYETVREVTGTADHDSSA
jgi:hypothetical protein